MRLPLLLLAAVLLAGCTDDPAPPQAFPLPPASDFLEGTCALVADDVLALGRAARALGDAPEVPPEQRTALETPQKALAAVAETAEPELKVLLEAVATRTGLVRLSADVGRFDPEVLEPLEESYGALVATCTGRAAATSTATTG